MMNRSKSVSKIFVAIALLSGCATTPIPSSQANNVSADKRLDFSSAIPGTAPVVITRDAGIMSSACSTRVFVDGKLAAYVGAGQKVLLHIPAGDVILGAQPDGLCAGGLVEIEARLKAGEPNQYRIVYDQNGSLGLYRTAIR